MESQGGGTEEGVNYHQTMGAGNNANHKFHREQLLPIADTHYR